MKYNKTYATQKVFRKYKTENAKIHIMEMHVIQKKLHVNVNSSVCIILWHIAEHTLNTLAPERNNYCLRLERSSWHMNSVIFHALKGSWLQPNHWLTTNH